MNKIGISGTTLPQELFDQIVKLAHDPDVRSVACPMTDYGLWRALVAEQVRRAVALGVPPQEALTLNGPDSGIPGVIERGSTVAQEWGGEIHIPYEVTCGGDLFIHPKWFGFSVDRARTATTLSEAVFGNMGLAGFKTCKYLLTHWKALGEIASARRTVVGEWVLYASDPRPVEQPN